MSERKVEAFERISGAFGFLLARRILNGRSSPRPRRPEWNICHISGMPTGVDATSAGENRARMSLCTHSDQNRGGNSGREAYKELPGTPHKWLNRTRSLVLPEKLVETVGIATLPTNFRVGAVPRGRPHGRQPRAGGYVWRWDCQSWGTLPEGPGTGWSTGWFSGGARAGPSSKNSSVGNE
jgi:hypothetical protein